MGKLKNLIGNVVAIFYFISPMLAIIMLLLFMPLGFLMEVSSVRSSGFAGQNIWASFIGISGLSIGLSLIIPPLRKMYRVLPWLFPFVKIFYVNLIILNIGLAILNYGYEINNTARHLVFFILMILQIVLCRAAMCIYFKRKPVNHIEER